MRRSRAALVVLAWAWRAGNTDAAQRGAKIGVQNKCTQDTDAPLPALVADVLGELCQSHDLCTALRIVAGNDYYTPDASKSTKPADQSTRYKQRLISLAAWRELKQRNCQDDGKTEPPPVPQNVVISPADSERRAAGAFGASKREARAKLEEIDREREWLEAKQKHALRLLRRGPGEALGFDADLADLSAEDEYVARWALGKGPDDALPDARLRLGLQRVLGAERSPALEIEYGPPMDRSELMAKMANVRAHPRPAPPPRARLRPPPSIRIADRSRGLLRVAQGRRPAQQAAHPDATPC